MIRNLFVLSTVTVAWIATLWFGLRPDFTSWSWGRLFAAHAGPPLLFWSLWNSIAAYRERRRQRLATQKEAENAAVQAKALEAVRQQHADDLAKRRFHCETRWIDLRIKAAQPEALPDVDQPNVHIAASPAEPDAQDDEFSVSRQREEPSSIGGFAPQLYEALLALFDRCPATCTFPLYVVPARGLVGEDVLAGLRSIHREIVSAMEPEPIHPDGGLLVRYLPQGIGAGDAVLSAFESDPELPGLVVLAFDSPLANGRNRFSGEQRTGIPGQAVITMLFTAAGLNPHLVSCAAMPSATPADALTPYWQRQSNSPSRFKYLSNLAPVACDRLQQLPVLAQIRRAARHAVDPVTPVRTLDTANGLHCVLQEAKINAGLLTPPLLVDGVAVEPSELASTEYGWLVHNLGDGPQAATALSALGAAMTQQAIPLDLTAQASNTVAVFGDFGEAASIGILALSALHCAALHQAVLLAEFEETGGRTAAASVSFTIPAATA